MAACVVIVTIARVVVFMAAYVLSLSRQRVCCRRHGSVCVVVITAARVLSSSWQCVCVCGERLHQLVAQTLTEAVEDKQQQRGGNQTDQDHAQPQLTNH